ncbi:MAG: alpha/beta fold hydrolase [Dehalococcoidia bacterium]
MPAVFVHGNPETDAIWDALFGHLARKDVVALSPPGFGAPAAESFAATSDAYVAWLEGELRRLDGPIDLVGHDWGGGHVMRLVLAHPELVRSWAMDIAGCFDPEYVWHDMAQVWQTPEAGEAAVAGMVGAPLEARTAQFESLGMSKDVAARVAAANDATMARCILALYRSAKQPAMTEWGKALPKAAARPGLVIIATGDHYTGGEVLARRSAQRAGAKVAMLEGLGHWWMCEDPAAGAKVLDEFWATLG